MDDYSRKLPSAIEAEQSVLGAMLIDNDCLSDVFGVLSSEHFSLEVHKQIFSAMYTIFETSRGGIDPVTLVEMLKENGTYSDEMGKEYIYTLSKSVPSASNIKKYCEIVKNKYLLRELIKACDDISENCYSENSPTEDILDMAEQKIFEIGNARNTSELVPLSKVTSEKLVKVEEAQNTEDKEEFTGIKTGFSSLDDILVGLGKGEFIVLAARPGVGKTSFALNIMRNIAKKTKKNCVFFSLEMSNEQLAERMLSSEACIDSKKLRTGNILDKEWVTLSDAAGLLYSYPILFNDKSGITVSEMKSHLRKVKNLGFVAIDYLQLLGSTKMTDNRVLEIQTFTRNLKIMAKDLNVPILVLSQLNRESEKRSSKPMLSDLRDSGSIEQDADKVLFLYQEKDKEGNPVNPNAVNCTVAKNRQGRTGDIKLQFIKEYTRFSTIDEHHEEY